MPCVMTYSHVKFGGMARDRLGALLEFSFRGWPGLGVGMGRLVRQR